MESYSNLPHSYDGEHASNTVLMGDYHFSVVDYELDQTSTESTVRESENFPEAFMVHHGIWFICGGDCGGDGGGGGLARESNSRSPFVQREDGLTVQLTPVYTMEEEA
ncbi:hypothetical protein HZH68_012711 [Vespula germanica]|uniref:Uncharacterized protein n=1 Tax=Vespula germanica TaxID=30212 RepID=A0A834MX90_VESGE|nr:hypothetical protein HZH68_012711 [Vespula germanica]